MIYKLLFCAVALFPSLAGAQTPLTIFGNATPVTAVDPDTNAVTLGVKFFSNVGGAISGIRFYRGHTNTSGYTVKLFTVTGSLLASARVRNETCTPLPCWEHVNFASPISLSAQTTYIAAYYTSNGRYAGDNNGLVNGAGAAPLYAQMCGGSAGGNGVYTYSTGFPNQTYQCSNYWVDVEFTPNAPTLMMSFNPPNPTIDSTSPPGTVIAAVVPSWSDGSPFTGGLSFVPPYGNDNGLVALNGSNVVVNGDFSGLSNTTQNATVDATQ
jgi:hypothetical protein